MQVARLNRELKEATERTEAQAADVKRLLGLLKSAREELEQLEAHRAADFENWSECVRARSRCGARRWSRCATT